MATNSWMMQCQLYYGKIVQLAQRAALAYKQGQNVSILNSQVEDEIAALSEDERRELADFVQKLAWTKSVNLGAVRLICPERYLFTAAICKAIAAGIQFNVFRVAESTRKTVDVLRSWAEKAQERGDFASSARFRMLAEEIRRYSPTKWFVGENGNSSAS